MVEGGGISIPGSRIEKRMKKGLPQQSFEEGTQKLQCDTGQYLVSWLRLTARETGKGCLYSEWPCTQLKMLYLWKKEQILADSYQSATLPLLSVCIFHFLVSPLF